MENFSKEQTTTSVIYPNKAIHYMKRILHSSIKPLSVNSNQ